MLGFGNRRVAEPLLERVHLGLHGEQHRRTRCVASSKTRAARVGQAVLRQVADGQRGRLEDRAGVGLVEPGHHPEQRGLAGAVRAAETDALAVRDLPRDVVEEDAVAEGLGEFGELDHRGAGSRVIRPEPWRRRRAPAARGTAW